jgi:hypothetical protein
VRPRQPSSLDAVTVAERAPALAREELWEDAAAPVCERLAGAKG